MKRMRKGWLLLLCAVIPALLGGCGVQSVGDTPSVLPFSEAHTVIFDTDMGADDAMALLLAVKAPNVSVIGVTTLSGNVPLEQCKKNALMTLEVAGRSDIPVYPGSTTRFSGEPIEAYSVFGEDGMGDRGLIHPAGKAEEQDAVSFILETVAAHPGEIEILVTGPMTNIAKAVAQNPAVMAEVKRIVCMGSAGIGMTGNASPIAEFNVYMDAPAFKAVCDAKIPLTIVGLDVCSKDGVTVTEERFAEWRSLGALGTFLAESQTGLWAYYQLNGKSAMDVCDPVAAAVLIWDGFVTESKRCHPEVITNHALAEGAVIFFEEGNAYDILNADEYHAVVVTDVRDDCYFDLIKALLLREP